MAFRIHDYDVEDADWNWINECIDTNAFTGFDPEYTGKQMMVKAANDIVQLRKDVQFILSFYVARGVRYDRSRIKDTMKEEAKVRMDALMLKYTVQFKIPTNKEDITLARIAATFPNVVAMIIDSSVKKNKMGLRIVSMEEGVKRGLPPAILTPVGCALIPTHADWDRTFELWLEWSEFFTKTIYNRLPRRDASQNRQVMAVGDALERQKFFAAVTRASSKVSDADRTIYLRNFGLGAPLK